jgi:hypothetical protein
MVNAEAAVGKVDLAGQWFFLNALRRKFQGFRSFAEGG